MSLWGKFQIQTITLAHGPQRLMAALQCKLHLFQLEEPPPVFTVLTLFKTVQSSESLLRLKANSQL